ncbi:hypothetical protein NW762_006331 [Fusarium torreyae]|uniref:Response regulatory domain-containing protein n=1 Tax=Fusarium torreyae TaxID=1237075 RepID=A0A9W8VF38_9HYPO|nr:hypothetical protein NW762_006331 [Fusarium torreyae]
MSETEKATDNAAQANASTEAPKTRETFQNSPEDAKYLLAEDNSVNQKLFNILFDRMQLHRQTAWNGQEAVDMYKANPERCRLILLDTSMPVMGGQEASLLIRQYEKENGLQPAIIVGMIAYSVGDGESDKKRLQDKFGMDTALSKPVRPQQLQELIDNYPV